MHTTDPWPAPIHHLPRLTRAIDPEPALNAALDVLPLVSVIMTTFNSEAHAQSAIRSILAQTHARLELLIVDDASTDETPNLIRRLQQADDRIRLICMDTNRGTYWAKNQGILESRGSVITFMDSDDVALDIRIAEQLNHLRQARTVGTLCHYVRVDEAGNIVLNRGLAERVAPISLMVKREVFADVGYFDTVRTSADSEFIDRLKIAYGKRAIGLVQQPLYRAILRQGSLSNQPGNGVALHSNAGSFLSPARAHYAFSYGKWHAQVAASGRTPYMPFPLTNRPFPAYGALRVHTNRFADEPVVAFMASFPPRRESLKCAVASLLPQVDRLYLYLNGYDDVPDFLRDERIVALPAAALEDLKDVGKLFHQRAVPHGYLFTVDDDIEYPPDYCSRMLLAVEAYDRKAIVGVHGVILEQPVTKYFSANRKVFHFREKLENDTPVNLLGTGTLCFHACAITFNPSEMPVGLLDIGVAVAARKMRVPMIAIARESQWLKPLDTAEAGSTLFEIFRGNDAEHSKWLAQQADWSILDAATA